MLKKPDIVTSSATRFSLHTETCGVVHFTCYVLLVDKSPKTDKLGLPPNVTSRPTMFKFDEKPAAESKRPDAVENPMRAEGVVPPGRI